MRNGIYVFVCFIVLVSCKRDNPKHHVREMIGSYTGSWTFNRNTGSTYEPGYIEVVQGSQKNTIYIGPEQVEFEINENLDPIILGNLYKLSFPEGTTDKIQFERYLDGTFADGSDVFVGTKE